MQAKLYTLSDGAALAKIKLVAWCLAEAVRLELRRMRWLCIQDVQQGVLSLFG